MKRFFSTEKEKEWIKGLYNDMSNVQFSVSFQTNNYLLSLKSTKLNRRNQEPYHQYAYDELPHDP